MTKFLKAAVLVFPMILLNVVAAQAIPSRYTIERAAQDAGCVKYSPRIRKISESGQFPKQYVFQVECDPVAKTYVIIVCEGDFRCWAE